MSLLSVADGLWAAECPVSPGPGFRMNTRMTVVRLQTGGLLLHSPIELEDAAAEEISGLGAVEHLVAPNLFHHFFLGAAKERWPDAIVWAPKGLRDKVPAAPVDRDLEPADPWLGDFAVFAVEGMPKFREYVLLHRPSKTLIVTDLVFFEPRGHTALTRIFFRLAGTRRGLTVSRLFKSMIKDRAAFAASVERLTRLDFERLLVAHGGILEERAQERFAEVIAKSV